MTLRHTGNACDIIAKILDVTANNASGFVPVGALTQKDCLEFHYGVGLKITRAELHIAASIVSLFTSRK